MNKLTATVQTITSAQGSTSIVCSYGNTVLRSVTLQPPLGLNVGSNATLIIHETRPILTTQPLSGAANALEGKIEKIEEGEILTRIIVKVAEEAVSVLTDTQTFLSAPFALNQTIFVAFKATDIAIEVNV